MGSKAELGTGLWGSEDPQDQWKPTQSESLQWGRYGKGPWVPRAAGELTRSYYGRVSFSSKYKEVIYLGRQERQQRWRANGPEVPITPQGCETLLSPGCYRRKKRRDETLWRTNSPEREFELQADWTLAQRRPLSQCRLGDL